MNWAAVLDRKTLERAVRPASLSVTLDSLRRNGFVRSYWVTDRNVYLDADKVALELASEVLGAAK